MSEIAKITIRNFQSHEYSVIEPAPAGQLTVVVGPTDVGKSAIMRALRWGLDNQPQGDGFKRNGCDFVEVELTTTKGDQIIRRRTATTNRYIVNGEVFEGFGNSVPLEVQEATGVRRVRLGDQEFLANLARQLDPPFLGSSISGPNRAKVLGKLAGTEAIDLASRDLSAEMYRWRQDAKRFEDEIASLQEQITQYDHLPMLADRLALLRSLANEIEIAQERLTKLKVLNEQYTNVSLRIAKGKAFIRALGDIDAADSAAKVAADRLELLGRMKAANDRYAAIVQRERAQRELLASLGDVDVAEAYAKAAEEQLRKQITLTVLADRFETIVGTEAELRLTLQRVKDLEQAERAAMEASSAATKLSMLKRLDTKLAEINGGCSRAMAAIEHAERSLEAEKLVADVPELLHRISSLRQQRYQLESIRQKFEAAIGAKELAEQTIAHAQERYTMLLAESGTCPLCGSEVDHKHITEVLAS